MGISKDNKDIGTAAAGIAVLALVVVGFKAFGSKPATAATPAKATDSELRLAYFPNITHAAALVGVDKGIFSQALPGYRLTTKVVNAGPEAMEALLAGAIDFAYVGPSPAVNTFIKSNGQALQIVAGACSGGASLIAADGTKILSVKDLDGKRIAVPQLGGTQDVSLRHFLAQNGLKSKESRGTVEIVPLKNPDILALFKQGQLDAAWVPEPWASRLKAEGKGKLVIDERELWPDHRFTTTVLVVRSAYAKEHPDVVEKFTAANTAAVAFLKDHPADAQLVVNNALKTLTGKPLKDEVLKEAWERVDFTTDPDPKSVVAFAKAAYDEGYLKSEPKVEGIFATTSSSGARDTKR